ncbi:Armadillo repeat-containing x-linked protein 1 [Plakobranchus ocellatus]|uniref:Armadillo repeat-containing x-linked protein 1 n=1 Tax=Plakobranchus ocellatus TaxID=259542 RepID=A0AAV4A5L9_9GAST|nr:Armadillo repeat-containing x-linked protein 1 [Plakobranchus ocellatus]
MGSPDGTKIALGLLASTSALILSYILLKKYGFRAIRNNLDKREDDEPPERLENETESNTPTNQCMEEGAEDEPAQATPKEKSALNTFGIEGGDDGQNQTSFIMLGDSLGSAPPEGGISVKKSDKSSDESSYDVIEDDRLVDTEEDEDDRVEEEHAADANASAKSPGAEKSAGDRLELESSLDTSMVMVEEAEGSNIEKSGSSFYTSADENFGLIPPEDVSKQGEQAPKDQEEDKVDPKVMELSITEDETTVMYKSASGANDSVTLEGKDSANDFTPEVEEFVRGEEVAADPASQQGMYDPDESAKHQNMAVTDAVLRAELKASPASAAQNMPQETGQELDFTQVTEVINKCQNSPMSVSKEDISLLVHLLQRNMPELQPTVLNSIVRIAAFSQNTTILRDSGCPEEIVYQLKSNCESVLGGETGAEATLTLICQVITNLSMDPKAHPKLEESIPSLISLLLLDAPPESLVLSVLRPLINLSAVPTYHAYYVRAIPVLFRILDTGSTMVKVQSLKILVNLSLDEDMVPHLLAAKAPVCFMDLLESSSDSDVILRTVTMLANIFVAMKEKTIDRGALPVGPNADLSLCVFVILTDTDSILDLRTKVLHLTKHNDEDVCFQASRLYKNIPESSG